MRKKWIIELTEEERAELMDIVNKGTCAAYKIKNANIILKADQGEYGANWPDSQIAEAFGCRIQTVENIRKRFVEKGLKKAIEREKRTNYTYKLDGDAEAKLVALTCSPAPDGRSRWTMKLLAGRMVSLEYVESVSPSTICRVLKKTSLSPGE